MYHPPGYPHRLNTSDGHEKPRWDDSSRTLGMKNLPLPGGWSNKQQPFIHQLTASARVALMNVRRLAGQFWQVQASESIITSSKPLATRDSSFSMPVFVLLCGLWYTTSALSSNTGKAILSQFRYPITLTFIQFGFIATFCLLFMSPLVRFSKLRTPTKAILQNTFPMGLFQVGGHMFSSMAISRIPVSTVHTIKVRLICAVRRPILKIASGTLTPIYRCRLRPPVRRQLLKQNLHFPTPADHRCHARMFI